MSTLRIPNGSSDSPPALATRGMRGIADSATPPSRLAECEARDAAGFGWLYPFSELAALWMFTFEYAWQIEKAHGLGVYVLRRASQHILQQNFEIERDAE